MKACGDEAAREDSCDDMWVFENCGRCAQEPDLAAREGSGLCFALCFGLCFGLCFELCFELWPLPVFEKLSWLGTEGLELAKDLSLGRDRARLFAAFAR